MQEEEDTAVADETDPPPPPSPKNNCPGLFHGRIHFPMPIPCDGIHLVLGVLVGVVPTMHRAGTALFVLYQFLEEILVGDVHSFFKDVGVFLVGLVLGMGMYGGILGTTVTSEALFTACPPPQMPTRH